MAHFSEHVAATHVLKGNLAVFWLGQAGFLLKTSAGELAAIDPYLSDCCERYFGFKRLMPHLLEPHDLKLNALFISHAHYDHFDVDAVPMLVQDGTQLIGAADTAAACERLGIKKNTAFLRQGETAVCGGFTVQGIPCDHGELAPDALGLLISAEGKTIYFMGDTAYRPDLWENTQLHGTDLLILPINGAFGNLNEQEAARAVRILQPKLAVPCHFWNFAEHGGQPGLFQQAMDGAAVPYKLLSMGEGIMI